MWSVLWYYQMRPNHIKSYQTAQGIKSNLIKQSNCISCHSIRYWYNRILFILMRTNPIEAHSTHARKWKWILSNLADTHSIWFAGPCMVTQRKTGGWKQSWCQNSVPRGNCIMAYHVPVPPLEFTRAWLALRSSCSVNCSEMAISLYEGVNSPPLLLVPHTPRSNVRVCCHLRRKCDGLTALEFSSSKSQ